MHELKTAVVDQVAQKMERDDEIDQTISMTEIGLSVLTLFEVLQTFQVDSAMFNIKLHES
jgi:hypothetical protein